MKSESPGFPSFLRFHKVNDGHSDSGEDKEPDHVVWFDKLCKTNTFITEQQQRRFYEFHMQHFKAHWVGPHIPETWAQKQPPGELTVELTFLFIFTVHDILHCSVLTHTKTHCLSLITSSVLCISIFQTCPSFLSFPPPYTPPMFSINVCNA